MKFRDLPLHLLGATNPTAHPYHLYFLPPIQVIGYVPRSHWLQGTVITTTLSSIFIPTQVICDIPRSHWLQGTVITTTLSSIFTPTQVICDVPRSHWLQGTVITTTLSSIFTSTQVIGYVRAQCPSVIGAEVLS